MKSRVLNVVPRLAVGLCLMTSMQALTAGDFETPIAPAPPVADDGWKFDVAVYGWMATLNADLANGASAELDFSDILKDLNFTAMAAVHASKGKWTLGVDLINMQLTDDSGDKIRRFEVGDIDLSAWVITPTLGYRVAEGQWGAVNAIVGARYLWAKTKATTTFDEPQGPRSRTGSVSDSGWDGIVGVRGYFNIADGWFLPYEADIGTGDSDLVWQVFGGIGYHIGNWDLIAGYRYLEWDLSGALDNLNIGGPIVGAVYSF